MPTRRTWRTRSTSSARTVDANPASHGVAGHGTSARSVRLVPSDRAPGQVFSASRPGALATSPGPGSERPRGRLGACLKEAVPRDGGGNQGRRLRAPSCAHRVLHAGRRRPAQGHVRRLPAGGHAGRRHHRPRQRLRGLRLLGQGERRGHQADHRDRGLRGPRAPAVPAAGAVGNPGAEGRRRVRRRGVHPHDAARRDHRGHAQPVPAVLAGLARRLFPQAPDGPRTAGGARQGDHRHHRLRVRRGADQAPARPVRRGGRGGGRLPRHLRPGQLLRRDHGPRPGRSSSGSGTA